MGTGGDVFVLDMGKPVRIRDLAEKMIHLMGLTVRDDRQSRRRHRDSLHRAASRREALRGAVDRQQRDRARSIRSIMRAEEDFLPWEELKPLLDQLWTRVPAARLHQGARGAAARGRRLFADERGRGSRLAAPQCRDAREPRRQRHPARAATRESARRPTPLTLRDVGVLLRDDSVRLAAWPCLRKTVGSKLDRIDIRGLRRMPPEIDFPADGFHVVAGSVR